MRFLLWSALVLFMLSGCATNSMTGRSQLMIVNETSAVAKSANMYSALIGQFSEKGKLSTDQETLDRVRRITNRLVERAIEYRPETAKWEWQVNVIDDDKTINASCMPGGKMIVYTGIINKVQPTDDELAQVMGHEISHALAKHGAEKMSVAAIGNIAAAAVAAAAVSRDRTQNSYQRQQNAQNAQRLAAFGAAAFITLPNSRTAESEADRMGIELAARAGYDPAATLSFWKKMIEATGQRSKGDFLSTHPSPANRMDALEKLQEPMQKIYEEVRPTYTADYKPVHEYVQMNSWTPPLVAYNENDPEVAQLIHSSNARVFYSPQFEDFKAGKTDLACANCGTGFFVKQSEFKRLAETGDWRSLQLKVVDANYKLDLAYLYLGLAAEGMGFKDASTAYFHKASELSATEDFACTKGHMINCQGYDVPAIASSRINN